MSGHKDRLAAREEVIRCARAVTDLKRPLDSLAGAMEDLELAARDLVNAIDDLPPEERPEGWALTPEGETA